MPYSYICVDILPVFYERKKYEDYFSFYFFSVYETPFLYILVHLASENKMYMYTWRIQTECKCTPGSRFPLETLVRKYIELQLS